MTLTLYRLNAASEIGVGLATTANGLSLIARGAALLGEFNPFVFGLTLVILVVSVIIEMEKDPVTTEWVRQCLWGSENSYQDGTEEMQNFDKALAG